MKKKAKRTKSGNANTSGSEDVASNKAVVQGRTRSMSMSDVPDEGKSPDFEIQNFRRAAVAPARKRNHASVSINRKPSITYDGKDIIGRAEQVKERRAFSLPIIEKLRKERQEDPEGAPPSSLSWHPRVSWQNRWSGFRLLLSHLSCVCVCGTECGDQNVILARRGRRHRNTRTSSITSIAEI